MEITFTCPHCGEVTLIDESFVGQAGECRACGHKVTVPPIVAPASRPTETSNPVRRKSGFGGCLLYGFCAFAVLFILTLCLLPNVRYARPAARRMQSQNNLKQIALAMHSYNDMHGHFPRAYHLTADGERTLSWRVAILPFIEHQSYSERYKPEEPWNSESNLPIGKLRVDTYEMPGKEDTAAFETGYMVITGPGTLFEEGKDLSFADCLDGSSNTILAVEVKDSGVNWAQPVDLDIRNMIFKINGGAFGIGSPWAGGAQVAFADGSVRFLSNDTLESTLRAMTTRAGGEAIDRDD